MALPHFYVIGAMKCGTSTLQGQLAAQPGVFMCTPKEPNFFSDDSVYARGLGWYEGLFAQAPADALRGEASTHYAKLPTFPDCVERLAAATPAARFIYVTRDPFDRLVSHYIHEWTMGVMGGGLDAAIDRHPELVDYGRYGMQIAPYVARFGRDRIHLTSLERMRADPDRELAAIGRFLGAASPFEWRAEIAPANVSAQRERRLPLHGILVENRLAGAVRRTLVPRALRERVRRGLRMRQRPTLSDATRARLAPIFEADRDDLARLFPEVAEPAPA